jgi:hypothetical protein
MSKAQTPTTCGSYMHGHCTHWIQARKGWEDEVNLPLPGQLLSVESSGIVVIDLHGRQIRLWNHFPERIADTVASTRGAILYQARWSLLLVERGQGIRTLFSVVEPPEKHVPCPRKPSSDTLQKTNTDRF